MQTSSTSSAAQPEAILEWLQKEMGYRPLGPYTATKAAMPSVEAIRKVCRGNMIPVWTFLLKRVKSEKTVENIRRNIMVHGGEEREGEAAGVVKSERGGEGGRGRGRRRERVGNEREGGDREREGESSKESAVAERDAAEKEVERLRHVVRRQRKELKARMVEVAREEAERKRMLDERSNYRLDMSNQTLLLFIFFVLKFDVM